MIVNPRPAAREVGAVEDALRVHPSHDMVDGACSYCGARASWPRIEAACSARAAVHACRRSRRSSWQGLSAAQKMARRAANLRGAR